MTNKISVLPDALAQKIAAGEVVERPASCVKELVENSLDAGATNISIEIEDGGKALIRVTDNGCGMNKDDALLSLRRHATSKIKNEDDLYAIQTMGFRGEALPSIAAVSRIKLITKEIRGRGAEGVRIECEGGEIKTVEPAGCPEGTVVSVSDLFFNTPARKKFLKSVTSEFVRIADVLTRFALAFPGIGFKLLHNGNVVESFPACSLKERLFQVSGRQKSEGFVFAHHDEMGISCEGFISLPHSHQGSRSGQFFFVNRRAVRSPLLCKSLEVAYEDFIPKGRYPACVLFIALPPQDVDVNVHPAKHEVRFLKPPVVFEAVKKTVTETLSREKTLAPVEKLFAADIQNPGVFETPSSYAGTENINPIPYTLYSVPSDTFLQPSLVSAEFCIIGQAFKTILIAEKGDEIFMLDQHALHERVLFNKFKREFESAQNVSQPLLLPQTFEFMQKDVALLKEYASLFESLGFEFEAFGGNTVLLRRVPMFAKDFSAEKLTALLERLFDFPDALKKREFLEEKLLATAACKAAVKAGDGLSLEEMQKLFSVLDATESIAPSLYSCAHGRPTVIRVPKKDLLRQFGRT